MLPRLLPPNRELPLLTVRAPQRIKVVPRADLSLSLLGRLEFSLAGHVPWLEARLPVHLLLGSYLLPATASVRLQRAERIRHRGVFLR